MGIRNLFRRKDDANPAVDALAHRVDQIEERQEKLEERVRLVQERARITAHKPIGRARNGASKPA